MDLQAVARARRALDDAEAATDPDEKARHVNTALEAAGNSAERIPNKSLRDRLHKQILALNKGGKS